MKVNPGASAGLGSPTQHGTPSQLPQTRTPQPHPVAVLLFGKQPLRRLDRRRFPKLARGMRKLELARDQIADILGVPANVFEIVLAEGSNASISRDGEIAFGKDLLQAHQEDPDLLIGVLGHEIGHQPWTWPEGNLAGLGRSALQRLYREEEAKADRFAGRVLAELNLDPDSLCRLLLNDGRFEVGHSREYEPPEERVRMIREAFGRRRRALEAGRRWNPALAARARELR